MLRTISRTAKGNFALLSLGFALLAAVGIAAIRIPSTSFLIFSSSMTKAEK
jgi:hypothetical protein